MSRSPLRGLVAVYTALLLASTAALAGPEDGRVVRGQASITTTDQGVLVTQTSKRAVIDWRSFSIGGGETVRFQQPSARALAVNRVSGGERSVIDGTLTANGRVMLSNPAGITFGPTSRVDVAGLVATTARLAERDLDVAFAGDRFRFADAPPGSSVINDGTITVADRGLAALVAPWVANRGTITARVGTVRLASGSAFTVDLYGDGLLKIALDETMATALGAAPDGSAARIEQAGRIGADGGMVALEAAEADRIVDRLINMNGIIEARSTSRLTTGEIVLRGAGAGEIVVAGKLDASGLLGDDRRGGQVFVLGDDIRLSRTARVDVSGQTLAGAITFAGGTKGGGGFLPVGQLAVSDRATLQLDNLRSGEPFQAYAVTDAAPADLLPRGAVVTPIEPVRSVTYGLYDPVNPAIQVDLLTPGTAVGRSVAYQVRGDGQVFVEGAAVGGFATGGYGLFARSATGGTTDFSSTSTAGLAFGGADGALARLDGRLQSPFSSRQTGSFDVAALAVGPAGDAVGPQTRTIDERPRLPDPIRDPDATIRDVDNESDTTGETELASAEQCNSWRADHGVADAAVARCYAALALESIAVHASTSFGALLAALDDPSPISRARAVGELGEIGAYLSAAVPVLLEALVTEDDRVVRLAEGVMRDADSFARDVVPALGEATRDADDRVVRNAALALGELGAYATPALAVLDDTLDHADIAARFNAAQGITKVDAEMRATTLALARVAAARDRLGELEGALAEDRSPFRGRAVDTLTGVLDETRAGVPVILPALGSANPAERATAVAALGELDRIAGAAQPVLIQAVALPEARGLRETLAQISSEPPLDVAALRPLLQALNDREPAVRAAAAEALQSLAATASRAAADLDRLPREDPIVRRLADRAMTTLAGFAPAVLPAIEPAAGDEDVRVRGAAVTTLGHLGPRAEPAVPLLAAALAGGDMAVHRQAARSLGRIGVAPEVAVPALADRLVDPDPRVACEAARALGLFGDQAVAASPRLLAAAEADQAGPGFCAGVALLAVDPPAAAGLWSAELADLRVTLEVEAMLEAIKGPAPLPAERDMPVGPNAVAALPALVGALATAPESERPVLAALLLSVAEEVRDEVPWLARELAQGDAASRLTAVRLLGRLSAGTAAAVPGLIDGLGHPDQSVRFAMVRTLSLVTAQATAATRALLAVALEDESGAVRADARASLGRLAEVQRTAAQGAALVAEAPIGRAGQRLLQIDRRLLVSQ